MFEKICLIVLIVMSVSKMIAYILLAFTGKPKVSKPVSKIDSVLIVIWAVSLFGWVCSYASSHGY